MSTNSPGSIDPVAPADGLHLVLPGRVAPTGAGMEWVSGGWTLFTRAPLMWIISLILMFICFVAIGIIPFLGGIAAHLLQPVILAGYVVASHSLDRGGDFELDHLLAGFRKNFGNLVIVGLIFLAGEIVIIMIFVGFVLMTVGLSFLSNTQDILPTLMASAMTFLLGLLITLALLLPLIAAYWFAPALVVMHDMAPLDAMKASFYACFRNFMPFLVYSIVILVLSIVAVIPFGLGFLVVIPMMLAGVYVSYRDIFTEETAPVPAKPTFA